MASKPLFFWYKFSCKKVLSTNYIHKLPSMSRAYFIYYRFTEILRENIFLVPFCSASPDVYGGIVPGTQDSERIWKNLC
jgi:hypothetical protein